MREGEKPAKEQEKEQAVKWTKKQESEGRRGQGIGMRNARVIWSPQEGYMDGGEGVESPGAQGGHSSCAL